ncbi:MAG: hypothetical protein K2N89_13775 [Lachnospiraceae bacterium]|nr:hypothetical protein [Lachnospiraceae bacterium]
MRLIVAVPGAILGSLASVAKVISYTVLMIAELVLNIMLYMLTTDLIFSVASVITTTFVSTASSVFSSSFVSSGAFSTLVSILVIIFLIWFTIQAIKLRKPIVKSLEEMADNVVNKFITGQTAGGNAQGSGGQGESGTAKGAQIAAMEPKRRFRTPVGRACEKMKDTSKQEAFLGQMFGGNGSAFKEDQAFRQRDLEKRAAKKHARREMLEAGKQLAVGVGEFAAGTATGNAALMAQGAKNTLHGIGTANQAAENKYQADKNADTKLAMTLNPDIAKHDERLGYTKGQSRDIERMSLGNEMAQAVQLRGAGSAKAVSTFNSGSAVDSTDLRDNALAAHAGMNTDTENAMVPKPNMANNLEKNKNIRGQSKSIEKISLGNETDQEVQVSSTDGNRVVSAHGSSPAVNSINPKNNISFDKDTVKGVALSEIGGLLGNTQDSAVYTPMQTSRSVSAGNIINVNDVESNGQKSINSSRKSTGKSTDRGFDEGVHIQSSKKVVEHVNKKHETINEHSGDPNASAGQDSHNFVEQKLLTHVDQTEDIMKNRKNPYITEDDRLKGQADKSGRVPKNKKNEKRDLRD